MPEPLKSTELLPLVSEVVAAHLSRNSVPSSEMAALVRSIYQALATLGGGAAAAKAGPAVPIDKSVTPNYIVCLEDGRQLKMLKRHLRTAFNLSPEQYRQRWALPSSYPMVAPNYAKKRSKLAKAMGLGTKPKSRRA
jgi:predicted transcriptional regulator